MKNLKFLLLSIFAFGCFSSYGQGLQSYGHAPSLSRSYTEIGNYPYVSKLLGFDTLTAVDTGWMQWNLPNRYTQVIDLFVTKITGTLAGTAVLYGSNAATMPTVTSTTWQALTGVATYCAGCQGASATLTGSGTTQYTWHLPPDAGAYQYYQVRAIVTGTCTATYTARIVTKI